ncbi:MAG TPA: 50S ribosomal protein L32 [Candidatus Paceibacterota bacterium]
MYTLEVMVVRMRSTKSHRNNRRSHLKLENPSLIACDNCGEMKLKHIVCPNCGKYNNREVVDIIGKTTRKEAKKTEKKKETVPAK